MIQMSTNTDSQKLSSKIWHTISLILPIALLMVGGCSKGPGIEGQVLYFESNVPVAGIHVSAYTKSDIKEHQDKTRLDAVTDAEGRFVITGFIPNKTYTFRLTDTTVWEPIRAELKSSPPDEGTRMLKEAFRVLPVVDAGTLYTYHPATAKTEALDFTQVQQVTTFVADTPAAGDNMFKDLVEMRLLESGTFEENRIAVPEDVYLLMLPSPQLTKITPLQYFEGPIVRTIEHKARVEIESGWYLGIQSMQAMPGSAQQNLYKNTRNWPPYVIPYFCGPHDDRWTRSDRFVYNLGRKGKPRSSRGVFGDGVKGRAIKPRPGAYLVHTAGDIPAGHVLFVGDGKQ